MMWTVIVLSSGYACLPADFLIMYHIDYPSAPSAPHTSVAFLNATHHQSIWMFGSLLNE